MDGGVIPSDLRRPLLEHAQPENDNDDDNDYENIEEQASFLEEWNASVAAFVADDGGEDNVDCHCSSIEHEPDSDSDDDYDFEERAVEEDNSSDSSRWAVISSNLCRICKATLLPDAPPTLGSYFVESNDQGHQENQENENVSEGGDESGRIKEPRRLVDGPGAIKFLKLAVLTFGSIALVRWAVIAVGISDRDQSLTMTQIWVYEGDSILRDLAVFFVVGRMHHRTGVDTLEWIGFGLLANLYFESQAYLWWMQHSATPYEMHCLWPWQLWAFASIVILGVAGLLVGHAIVAHRHGRLWIAVGELLGCLGVFVLPVVASPYAHFHHWFAGWLLGMHANLHNEWWSRATMAYCWGMYVNGIAVYGRDPLLTCDYARFLAIDQNCPISMIGNDLGQDNSRGGGLISFLGELLFGLANGGGFEESNPPNWRNCTDSGYHP